MVSHNLKTISKKGGDEMEQTLKEADLFDEAEGEAADKSRYRDLVFKRIGPRSA